MNKIKVRIPKQSFSLKIEIDEQELDFEVGAFQPIWEVEPPVEDEKEQEQETTPPKEEEPKPPVNVGDSNNEIVLGGGQKMIKLSSIATDPSEAWEKGLQIDNSYLFIDSYENIFVERFNTVQPKALGIIGSGLGSELTFGRDKTPSKILEWSKGDYGNFGVAGLTINLEEGQRFQTGLQTKSLFNSKPDVLKSGLFGMVDCTTGYNHDQLGVALAGFIYGGINVTHPKETFIDVVADNVYYQGAVFTQLKANRGNNIRQTFNGLEIYNPVGHFTPTRFGGSGTFKQSSIKLNDIEVDLVKTHHGYQAVSTDGVVRTNIFVDRFVFALDNDVVSESDNSVNLKIVKNGDSFKYMITNRFDNNKTYANGEPNRVIISNAELQAGDQTSIGKVLKKQMFNSAVAGAWYRWAYVMDREVKETSGQSLMEQTSVNLELGQTYDVNLVYMYNGLFQSPYLTETSYYEPNPWYLFVSGGIGWSLYDANEISLNWNDVYISGFVRQSDNNLTPFKHTVDMDTIEFVDSSQWKPINPQPFEYPSRVKEYVDWLRELKNLVANR